jgi:hypothetical protein
VAEKKDREKGERRGGRKKKEGKRREDKNEEKGMDMDLSHHLLIEKSRKKESV